MPVEVVLTKGVTQLPTLTYPGWDDFGQIARTLRELENGQFRSAAVMADQMWRDDRFYAVMRKRLDALESIPLIVNPADGRATAKKIADNLGGIDDLPGRWDAQFPSPVLEELNQWGILMGIAIGEQIWKTDDEETPIDVAPGTKYSGGKRLRWTSRLKVWNPQWLRWDWSLFRYRLMTAMGEITLPDIEAEPRSDGKWIIWCPYGYNEAWKKGAVRAIARCITRRQWTDRDWSRHNEKNGLAIDKAIVPAGAPKEAKDAFFDAVSNRNSETTIMVEQSGDKEGPKFDIELVESTAKTWDTFEASKKDVNNDIAIVLIGQNTTTELSEGKGSLGVSGHAAVELNYLRKDAGIAGCLYQQGLTWDAEHNYGDPTLAPRPEWQVDPPEDQKAKADTVNSLGLGLAAMKTAGAPIDDRAVLEGAGLPVITPEEQAAREAVQKEEDAARAKQMAPGGGEPDGDEDPPAKGPKTGKAKMGAGGIVKRVTFAGLSVSVENPKGSTRYWREGGPEGPVTGSTVMKNDYGFLDGYMGNDGEEIDVYLGPDADSDQVYSVHQTHRPAYKKYDEDKIFLGFPSQAAALAAFVGHRDDGDAAAKHVSAMPLEVFKKKLRRRTGTGKIRASSSATIMALGALAARATSTMALARKTNNPKQLKHADALIKNSIMLGARSLAADLATVKHEIAAATDWKDLEGRLARAYAGMDPKRFADAVEKARMMANLSGQLSAVKQT